MLYNNKSAISLELAPVLTLGSTVDFYILTTITYVLLEDTYTSTDKEAQFYNYDPPLPDQDIRVLHQVFRI